MISRLRGAYIGRNKAAAYKDLVWTVATAPDLTKPIEEQTEETLKVIESNLKELGSSKEMILSAQVYLARISDKGKMEAVWQRWIGDNPDHWPQRACLGVDLEGDVLIEVTVTAAKSL